MSSCIFAFNNESLFFLFCVTVSRVYNFYLWAFKYQPVVITLGKIKVCMYVMYVYGFNNNYFDHISWLVITAKANHQS